MKKIKRISTSLKSGFTLIELLIVVGIVSILSTAVITAINPAELLRQARDATRLSDIDALHKALSVVRFDGLSLGNPNTIYVGIPDTTSTCANLGLPTLPSGWSYSCAPAATFKKVDGTGWIPVNFTLASTGSPLGTLPADPSNSTSSALFYVYATNGASFTVKAEAVESIKQLAKTPSGFTITNGTAFNLPYVFPTNWVKVPGNSTFGTSDFFVMKYEAKCIQGSTNTPMAWDLGSLHTYTSGCVGANYSASAPDGAPIANVYHDTAKTYCTNIGAHLITNDEWMTIARNAEQVGSNWTGGSVGNGSLYVGHSDVNPPYMLDADTGGDSNGYYGEISPTPNLRRTLTLSNGSIIWDVAGNVQEHVQRSTNNVGDVTTLTLMPTCSNGTAGWEWCEYGNSTLPYISAWTSDVAQAKVGSSNTSWNSTQGVGQVRTYGAGGSANNANIFIRGGLMGWGPAAGGIYSLYLYGATISGSDWGYDLGFRCAR